MKIFNILYRHNIYMIAFSSETQNLSRLKLSSWVAMGGLKKVKVLSHRPDVFTKTPKMCQKKILPSERLHHGTDVTPQSLHSSVIGTEMRCRSRPFIFYSTLKHNTQHRRDDFTASNTTLVWDFSPSQNRLQLVPIETDKDTRLVHSMKLRKHWSVSINIKGTF